MAAEVDLAATPVADVGIELRCPEIRVAEHLLNAPKIGPALEEVGREGVAQEMGVDALGFEPGSLGQAPEDQEGSCASQRAPLGVEEELRPVAAIEKRTPMREVAAQRLGGVPADRHDPLLAALAGAGDEPPLEVYIGLAQPDGLADPEAGAVQELHERSVSE